MFAKNTSVKNSSAKQIGWVKEDDKPLFLEFTNSIDDIEELSIEFSSGVINRENWDSNNNSFKARRAPGSK